MTELLAGIGGALIAGFAAIAFLSFIVLVAIVVSNGTKDYDLSEEEHLCDDGLPSWGWEDQESSGSYNPDSYYDFLADQDAATEAGSREGNPEADSGLAETVRPGALEAEQRVGVRGPTDDSAGS